MLYSIDCGGVLSQHTRKSLYSYLLTVTEGFMPLSVAMLKINFVNQWISSLPEAASHRLGINRIIR